MRSLFTKSPSDPFNQNEQTFWQRAKKKARQLIFETPIEILIGVLLVGSITGGLVYRNRAARAGEIPLAFSEIEQISQDFNAKGQPVPALTKFYAVNNDVTMKVFESSNIAFALGNSDVVFAHEMQTRIDAALKKHALISEYAAEMPQDAQNALNSVDKVAKAEQDLPALNSALSRVWDESHYDHYHTEIYYTTDCDSDGKNCHSTMHTRQVYDYTTHSYSYHPQAAAYASRLLHAFLENHPDMNIGETLVLARQTHAENEEAIRSSMKRVLDGKTPTEAQYLQFANTWAHGSNLLKYMPQVLSNEASLQSLTPSFDAAMRTAHSTSYITYSHYDSGPREFQVSESTEGHSADFLKAAHGIIDGITFSGRKIPELNEKIKDYVDVVLHQKPGDAKKLRAEIMKDARAVYDNNYENGFDVHPFKWLDVILLTLLGMAAGGLAGFGADRFFDSKKWEWYLNPKRSEDDPFRRSETTWSSSGSSPSSYGRKSASEDFTTRAKPTVEQDNTPAPAAAGTPAATPEPAPQPHPGSVQDDTPPAGMSEEQRKSFFKKYRKISM